MRQHAIDCVANGSRRDADQLNRIYLRAICAALVSSLALVAIPENALAQHGGGGALMPADTLDPASIPKYEEPLVIPPAIPRTSVLNMPKAKKVDYYEIAVRQFQQNILPASMNKPTTVWSYGSVNHPGTFNYPAFTIEAKWEQPVRVKWINELVVDPVDCFHTPGGPVDAESCNFLPHLLPVDETLHWANPPTDVPCKTGSPDTDCRTNCVEDGQGGFDCSYDGPVPMIVHVHGAETYEWSDGYPEAWYLPAANNLEDGMGSPLYTSGGSFFGTFNGEADTFFANDPNNWPDASWGPGQATFQYPNTQEATTLWYHDHSLGMTRLNVYTGPAGFYLLRGGPGDMIGRTSPGPAASLPGPAPALGDPPGLDYYEIPIVVQDRSFWDDGELFYPDNRAFFEDLEPEQLQIPFIPEETEDGDISDVSPIWVPEFFGNTLVTNGKTWPALDVEKRRYRFRLLNGSQSRFLIMQFSTSQDGDHTSPATNVGVWQIGAEQGFLPAPVNIGAGSTNGVDGGILMGPAERADMIIDFSEVPEGTVIYLRNFAPDEPFGGGDVGVDFDPADPDTTGQVMKFTVVKRKGNDKSTPPDELALPAPPVLGAPGSTPRTISLNELESETVCAREDGDNIVEVSWDNCDPDNQEPEFDDAFAFGPTEARLGTLVGGEGNPLGWADLITENPGVGATEVWEMYNFTADAHPIHIHLIQFQVVERQLLAVDEEGETIQPAVLCEAEEQEGCEDRGPVIRAPEVWETGYKDTVIAYPGEITRVIAEYPLAGLFVWHCHILEHEDNEMMRPYCVGDPEQVASCKKHNDTAHGNGE
jgi:spore coat protein A